MGQATESKQSKGDYGAREALAKAEGPASSKQGADHKTPYKHRG